MKKPSLVIGRAYLDGLFTKEKTRGPKAVLLMRKDTGGKNKNLCSAFIDRVPTVELLVALSDTPVIPTYWLITGPIETRYKNDCRWLREHYDFDQANALLSLYGLSDRKGPVLLAVDAQDNFMIVDMSKASGGDMKKFITTWFQKMPDNGELVINSVTLADRLRPFVCGVLTDGSTHLAQKNADISKPASVIQLAAGAFKNVSWVGVGALLIGRTFGGAFCPATTTLAPTKT